MNTLEDFVEQFRDEQRAELERRLQDSIDNPDAITPWEVVRQRLRERVKA